MGATKKMLDNPLFRGLYELSQQFETDIYRNLEQVVEANTPVSGETFECIKGDYKTTIECKFNKHGYLVGTRSKVEKIEVPKEHRVSSSRDSYHKCSYEAIKKKIKEKRSVGFN